MKNKIDLFINIASFQEMEPDILSNYFEIISSNKSILYHCNRHAKTLSEGLAAIESLHTAIGVVHGVGISAT